MSAPECRHGKIAPHCDACRYHAAIVEWHTARVLDEATVYAHRTALERDLEAARRASNTPPKSPEREQWQLAYDLAEKAREATKEPQRRLTEATAALVAIAEEGI